MCLTVEDQTFGDKLKIAREQHNLTRVQLAEQIGSSSKTIARWERGETLPRSQFHQKLCAILNTTPQELGLEIKTVEEKQKRSPIHQHNSSQNSPVTPSLDEPEKRSKLSILYLDIGVSWIGLHFDRTPLVTPSRPLIISGSGIVGAIRASTGSGKSSVFNVLFGTHSQEESLKTASVVESTNVLKYPLLNISFPKDIGNKALYGFFRGKVIFLAHSDGKKYIPYIVENLTAMYRYALISNLYGIIPPTFFTIHLQIDIGEIVTSMTNVIQTIHQVLSDPSWQGLGVVISIVLPIIMGYKKKSSLVFPLFAPLALAA